MTVPTILRLRHDVRFANYIRQWVPELANIPDPAIHDPETSCCRPKAYPSKQIGHREARERALTAGKKVR